jgi:hypothetical protein
LLVREKSCALIISLMSTVYVWGGERGGNKSNLKCRYAFLAGGGCEAAVDSIF